MSDKSGPNPPDYMGLANRSADLSWNLANQQTWQNRPNMNTPYGSYSWTPPTTATPPEYAPPSQMATGPGTSGGPETGTTPGAPPVNPNRPTVPNIENPSAPGAGPGQGLRPIMPVLGEYPPANPTYDPTGGGVLHPPAAGDVTPSTGTPSNPDAPYRPAPSMSSALRGSSVPGSMYAGGSSTFSESGGAMPSLGGLKLENPNATAPGGDPNRWTYNVTLSPDQQKLLDQSEQLGMGVNQAALDRLGQGISGQRVEDALFGRYASRLDPQFERQGNQLTTRLYNMGLREGDAAFTDAMSQFGQTKNDAYENAMRQAIAGGDQSAASQVNIINALRSGGQAGYPQQANFMGASQGQTPDLMGAANSAYMAQLGQQNARNAGMGGFLGGLAQLAPFLF